MALPADNFSIGPFEVTRRKLLGGSCAHFLTGSEKRAVAAQMQARFETTSAVAGCELGNYEIYFIKTGLFARPASRAIA